MKLVRGPWKPIFSGEWLGHRTEMLQNPEKTIATLIHDETGALLLMDHYFICTGQLGKLSEKLNANSQVLQKNFGTFNASYMIISTEPAYFKRQALEDGFEETIEKLDKDMEEFNDIAHEFGVEVTDIRHAKEEYSLHAFSEPSLLISAVKRGKTMIQRPAEVSGMVLGKTATGETVEEKMTDMFTMIVVGKHRKNAMQVVMENVTLSKMTAIVLDDSGDFQKVEEPNKEFDYRAYPELQAMGMPTKKPRAWVNLNDLNSHTIMEMLDINSNGDKQPFHGQDALKLLSEVITSKSGKLSGVSDVIKALIAHREDEFQKYRAIRWLLAIEDRHPGILDGEIDPKSIASQISGTGSVVLIDAALPKNIKRALAYSMLKALSRMEGGEPKAVFFSLNSTSLFDSTSKLGEEIAEQLVRVQSKGIGYCLGADSASGIHAELLSRADASIEMVNDHEAAVKKKRSKPYRLLLRTPLSE
ncbi:hypothetical protein HYS54_02895 [Candidatus Micrarchaeota archaeon]|nr:hypothetical protein [Candidatus Micrarchaeota archaeon]